MKYKTNKLISDELYKSQDLFFVVLAGVAVITSALHFWPFGDSKIWQMFNVPNLCCGIGLAAAGLFLMLKKTRSQVLESRPHISVIIYLVINIML